MTILPDTVTVKVAMLPSGMVVIPAGDVIALLRSKALAADADRLEQHCAGFINDHVGSN